MARNYAALFHEYLEEMDSLNDAEFGRLCRALLEYSMSRTPIALCGNERFFAKRVMMQEDRVRESYESMTEQRRAAAKASAEKRAATNASESKQPLTSVDESERPLTKPGETGQIKIESKIKTKIKTDIKASNEAKKNARDEAFERFWASYPKKVGKGAAQASFAKLDASVFPLLVPAVEAQKKTAQWQRDNGQYIPNPATWLNQKRWLDEGTETAPMGDRNSWMDKYM